MPAAVAEGGWRCVRCEINRRIREILQERKKEGVNKVATDQHDKLTAFTIKAYLL